MDTRHSSRVADRSTAERGDLTRQKLLLAAIDVFGRRGFDGATTRELARAASVNLQAIPYHFGGKQGLYIAAAEHIATMIEARVGPARDAVRLRLEEARAAATPVAAGDARELMARILERMAEMFIAPQSEPWARFLVREQLEPTEAFQRVFGKVMKPLLDLLGTLVGLILGEDPESEHVRLRTLSLVGALLVFRVANAAAMAHLGWSAVGPPEMDRVRDLARELALSIEKPRGRP